MKYAIQTQAAPAVIKRPEARVCKQRLMLHGSVLAAAATMGVVQADMAFAQTTPTIAPREDGTRAVQANASFRQGTGTVTNNSPLRDTIVVDQEATIIRWDTLDQLTLDQTTDYINFLPTGTEMIFEGPTGGYVVLNRVFGAEAASGFRGIGIDGAVNSFRGNRDSGTQGGDIWFYSPGGILASRNSSFNVGSLLLTTSNIPTIDDGLAVSNGGQVGFTGVTQEDSSVILQSGPGIRTSGLNSYVAVFAPIVRQEGNVASAGSALYGAGEQGTLTINNGLMDLEITVGTADATGITHTGSTVGGESSNTAIQREISLVAVSKNDAIQMLVGGELGYDQASSVSVAQGSIFLSSGSADAGDKSDINLSDVSLTTNTLIDVTGKATINADGDTSDFNFGNFVNDPTLTIIADGGIDVLASRGGQVNIGGDLLLFGQNGESGSDIFIGIDNTANPSTTTTRMIVRGNLLANAQGFGEDDFTVGGVGGDGVGGDIRTFVVGGADLTVLGDFNVFSGGQAGLGSLGTGNAVAGDIALSALGNSTITVNGDLNLDAQAVEAQSPFAAFSFAPITTLTDPFPPANPGLTDVGGNAVGGDISVVAVDSDTSFGALEINVDATASSGLDSSVFQRNNAAGGSIVIDLTGGTHDFGADLSLLARSVAGTSFSSIGTETIGDVTAGSVSVSLDNTSLDFSDFLIDTRSKGDKFGSSGTTGAVLLSNGADFTAGQFEIVTTHYNSFSSRLGISGDIDVFVENSSLDLGDAVLDARATMGDDAPDWVAIRGGQIDVRATDTGSITGTSLIADAGASNDVGVVGQAIVQGGTVGVTADNATIAITGITTLRSSVDGATGGAQGTTRAQGGAVSLNLLGAAPDVDFGSLGMDASATANGGFVDTNFAGDGGRAIGGTVTVNAASGTLDTDIILLSATAEGGSGGTQIANIGDSAGDGGDGIGGTVALNISGGSVTADFVSLNASAEEGLGATGDVADGASSGGDGGDATGGQTSVGLLGGSLTTDSLTLFTVGGRGDDDSSPRSGGRGFGVDAGNGGTNSGGTASFNQDGGDLNLTGIVLLDAQARAVPSGASQEGLDGSLTVDAGDGGDGGNAIGGTVNYTHLSGLNTATSVILSASGSGGRGSDSLSPEGDPSPGAGGNGGTGTGGAINVSLGETELFTKPYILTAAGTGGIGGLGNGDPAGGNGGAAVGGAIDFSVETGTIVTPNGFTANASGTGGDAGLINGNLAGNSGGDGTGGSVTLSTSGAGAGFTTNDFAVIMVNGVGGAGGSPLDGNDFASNGGSGGDGFGGAIAIDAAADSTLVVIAEDGDGNLDNLTADGIGGAGGAGGDGVGVAGGLGGDGGAGTGGSIDITAGAQATLGIQTSGEDFRLNSRGFGGTGGLGGSSDVAPDLDPGLNGSATGGTIDLAANGIEADFIVNGNLVADVSATGLLDARAGGSGSDATGGSISITAANNATFNTVGGLSALAFARAGASADSAGTGTGGTVTLALSEAGSNFEIDGTFATGRVFEPADNSLYVDASAYEGFSAPQGLVSAVGGDTNGGDIVIDFADGDSQFAGAANLVADSGTSSPVDIGTLVSSDVVNDAAAVGGSITINLTRGTNQWDGGFTASADTLGFGGAATAGEITANLDAATVDTGTAGFILGTLTGGETLLADPVTVEMNVLNGSSITSGAIFLSAAAGHGVSANPIVSGDVNLLVDASIIDAGVIQIATLADAFLFDAATNDTGADALAGDITVNFQNGSSITGQVNLDSSAVSDAGPDGGDATSGTQTVNIADSTVNGSFLVLRSSAEALGGQADGGAGGNALTGDMTVNVTGTSSLTTSLLIDAVVRNSYLDSSLGALGDGTAGDTSLNIADGTASLNFIIYTADLSAADADNGTRGSNLSGGTFGIDVDGGTLNTGNVAVNGDVTGGNGGDAVDGLGLGAAAGGLGAGVGVTIAESGGGTIDFGSVIIANRGLGGAGGSGDDAGEAGGRGGTGIGGDTSVTGAVSFDSLAVTSDAVGADGGLTAIGSGGFGANGGGAIAGSLSVDTTGDLTATTAIDFSGTATGGDASDGQDGGAGGFGGNATSGDFSLAIAADGTTGTALTTLLADVSATGGAGGAGGEGFIASPGGQGGDGGAANSGSAGLILNGADTVLQFGAATVQFDSDAVGGAGGTGGQNVFGSTSGPGGDGGDATSDTMQLTINDGATLNTAGLVNPFELASSATGGAGGAGGALDLTNGGTAGSGGAGGAATTSEVRILKDDGDLIAGDLNMITTAQGGAGGLGGSDGGGITGASGNGGQAFAGALTFNNAFSAGGSTTANDLTIRSEAIGGLAGDVDAVDGTAVSNGVLFLSGRNEPGNVLDFGSITLESLADLGSGFAEYLPQITDVTVAGDVVLTSSGDIFFDPDGETTLITGGNVILDAGTDINLFQTGVADGGGLLTIDAGGDFTANAGGSFFGTAGGTFPAEVTTVISADGSVFIRAGDDIETFDVRAADTINLIAGGNVLLGDATITGPVQSSAGDGGLLIDNGVFVSAGFDLDAGLFAPEADITVLGNVTSSGEVSFIAGGSVTAETGASVISDNALTISTGDDIVIAAGASVEGAANPLIAANPADPFGSGAVVTLQAGALDGLLSAPRTTPVASIVAPGAIAANGGAVSLTAGAIDAAGGTVSGSSIRADINGAPATGAPRSDDAGLLTAPCLEGSICLGTLAFDNRLEVGQNSDNGVIDFSAEGGEFNANAILISTRDDIVLGAAGVPADLTAVDEFALESSEGDVDLGNAEVTSDQITIEAAGSLLGNGSLTSANDIGVTVGADISAAVIDTVGQLTEVAAIGGALENSYNAPGDVTIGTLSQGTGPARILAVGDIDIGTINLATAGDIDLVAGDGGAGTGDVALDSATGAINVTLTGDNVDYAAIDAAGNVNLSAVDGAVTGGDLTAGAALNITGDTISVGTLSSALGTTIDAVNGDVDAGDINAGGQLVVDATGSITAGDVSAGATALRLDAGGDLTVGNAQTTAGDLSLTSAGTTDFASVSSARLTTITGAVITGGDVASAASTAITGGAVSVGDVTSDTGFTNVIATGGDLTAGNLTATTGSVRAEADGNLTTGDLSGSGIDVIGGGDTVIGDANASASLTVSSGGNLTTGDLVSLAVSPGASIDAAGDADIASVSAQGLLTVDVGGALTGGDFSGASLTRITGDSVDLTSVDSGNSATVTGTGGDVTLGSANAAVILTVDAAGAATVGAASSDLDVIISGSSVTLDTADAGRGLSVDASAGDLTATGTLIAAADAALTATGAVTLADVNAGGNFTADGASFAAGNVSGESILIASDADILFDSLTATQDLTLDAANGAIAVRDAADAGDITVGGDVDLTAQSLDLGQVDAGGSLTAQSTSGDLSLDAAIAGTDIAITSAADATVLDVISGGNTQISGANVLLGDTEIGGNLAATATGSLTGQTLDALGDISLAGQTIQAGDSTSGGSFTANASTGDATFGVVDAATDIDITAAGTPTVANVISGADTTITGASVTLDSGDVGGDLALTSTAGDLDATGAIDVGGAIDLNAAGAIAFGTLDAAGGDFNAAATNGGPITYDAASASGDLGFVADGAITGGDVTAGGALALTGADIDIGNGSGDQITLDSGANILFSSLTSPNAISLTAADGLIQDRDGGDSVDSGSDVTLDAQLIDVADITSGGAVSGNASAGAATFAAIDAAGAVTISAADAAATGNIGSGGDVSVTGADVSTGGITAAGDLVLDAATGDLTVGGDADVTGAATLGAAGSVTLGALTAQTGDVSVISGGATDFAEISSGGDLAVTAGGAVTGGDLDANGTALLDAADIAVGNVTADIIDFTSGADILFDSVTSTGALTLDAASGSIGANAGPGDIDSGGDTALTAQVIALGDVASAGSLSATATAGDATLGTASAVTDLTVSATGAASVENAISGGDTNVSGASVTVGAGTVGGDLALAASAGDLDAAGTLTVGGAVDLDASGDAAFNDLAAGGEFTVDAGQDVTFGSASTTQGALTMNAGGAITGGDVMTSFATGADNISLNANGDIAIGNVDSGADILIDGTAVQTGNLDAASGAITVTATGPAQLGNLNSIGVSSVAADGIDVGSVTAGFGIELDAGDGDLTATGGLNSGADVDVTVGGTADLAGVSATEAIAIDAGVLTAGNLTAGTTIATATTGATTLGLINSQEGSSITGSTIDLAGGFAGGDLVVAATGGDLNVTGDLSAAGTADLDAAGDADLASVFAGGNLALDTGGAANFELLDSTGDLSVNAGAAVAGGDLDAAGALTINGADVAIGAAAGDSIAVTSGADIQFGSLTSGTTTDLAASDGSIIGTGTIDSGGDAVLTAQTIAVGNVASGGSIGATASAGDASFGAVNAAQDITINALGTPNLTSATSGGDTSITGDSVTLDAADVGGDLTLNAVSGDVDAAGVLTVGGGIDLDAAGDVSFGALDAQGGDFDVDAGGDVNFSDAATSGDLTVDAGAAVNGGDVTTGGLGQIAGQNVTVGDVTTGAEFSADGGTGSVTAGSIDSGAGTTLSSDAGITAGDISSAADGVLLASQGAITAGTISSTGTDAFISVISSDDVSFAALVSQGSVTASGSNVGGGNVSGADDILIEGEEVSVGDVASTAGNVTVNGSLSNVTTGAVSAAQDVQISSAGDLTVGSADAAGDVSFAASSIAAGDVASGGSITADASAGDAVFGAVNAANDIAITAAGTPSLASATSGGNTSITGAQVALNDADIGGDLALSATAGDLDASGVLNVGGSLDLDASGDVTFGDLTVPGGDFSANAGGDIAGDAVGAAGTVELVAGEDIAVGDIISGGATTVDAAGTFLGGDITQTGGALAISATGGATFEDASGSDSASVSSLGPVQFGNLASAGAVSVTSQDNIGGMAISAGGDVAVDGADVAIASLETSNGDIVAGAFSGSVNVSTASGAGDVTLFADGEVSADTIEAGQNVTVNGFNAVLGTVDAGGSLTSQIDGPGGFSADTLTVGDAVTINAGNAPIVIGSALNAGGATTLTSGGGVSGGAITSGDDLNISAAEIDLAAVSATGDATLVSNLGSTTLGSASAGGALSIDSIGAVTLADAAGESIALTAQNGALTITNDLVSTATGAVDVVLTGADVEITDVNRLRASRIDATDGSIVINTQDDAVLGQTVSVGDVTITSANGSVLADLIVAGAAQPTSAAPSGGITTAALTGNETGAITITAAQDVSSALQSTGDIGIDAGRNIALQASAADGSIALDSGGDTLIESGVSAAIDITANSAGVFDILGTGASLEAGQALDITATDRFQTGGLASGSSVAITAGDVIIGDDGQIGDATATGLVTLQNQGAAVTLGGDGGADGFVIDADEFTRISSNGDLAVIAVSDPSGSTSPDALVTIDDFTVTAGTGNIGSDGSFVIDSQGDIDVIGALDLTGAGQDTSLQIFSAEDISLAGEAANLRIEDGNGGLAGSLELQAGNILAGNNAVLDDPDGFSLEGLDEALAQPSGAARDEGFFQAGAISFTVDNYLLIENTGTDIAVQNRRGFVADSVNIVAGDTGDIINIVINGTIGGESGVQAVSLATFEGEFDGLSTINGCLILNPAGCIPIVVPDSPVITDPVQDVIEEELRENEDSALEADAVGTMLILLNDPNTDEDDMLIDDPVTGAGNDDLWNNFIDEDEDDDDDEETKEDADEGEEELEPAE